MKILIVEDSVPQAESLEMLLRLEGHTVYTAYSGDGGRAVAETHPPDAVILDWVMPSGGFDFLSWLRLHPTLSAVPVVVSTGLPREAVRLDGAPGVTVLEKPYTVDELRAALRGEA